jgi:superfamily II DNA or RNA helicase
MDDTAQIALLPNNKYAQINLKNEVLLKKLNRLLSYREPGSEFSPQARNFGWNGIIHLMNKKNQFPLGLLETVKKFLLDNAIAFEIIDERKLVEAAEPIDISKRLAKLNKLPRYYQVNAVKAALDNPRGIIKATTGAGKTLIAAILTAAINKPTNIFVIGLDLLSQFHTLFSEVFDEEIGYVGDGVCNLQRINIISLWTAAKALNPKKKIKVIDEDDDKEKFNESDTDKIVAAIKGGKVIIFDECHSASTESFKKLYANINPEYLYGMSGTPHKLEETDILIKGFLGEIIIDIQASELIEKGFLVKPIIKFFEVPKMYIENKTYTGIYKEYVVENPIRNGMVVDYTKKLVENGFQTLVLFRQISHGKQLFEMLKKAGIEVEMLSGKDKLEQRENVKERLLSKKLNCVVASSIFDIGVDISSLNALVLASPNKSLVRALQRIGRVIRPFPGKTEVRVIDFYDNVMYLKSHSKRRYQIYSQEKGFEVSLPKSIKF